MIGKTNPSAAASPGSVGAMVPGLDDESDNASAIQHAMDEVHGLGGGTVMLPSGRWPIGAPIELRDNVTLRGTGMLVSTICPLDDSRGPLLISAGEPLAGATVEDLWLDGRPMADPTRSPTTTPGETAAIDISGGATFCVLRRIRMSDLPTDGVRLTGPDLDHLYLEQLVIEGCGGDGITFAPSGPSSAVFLTELSIRDFGRAGPGSAAVRLRGRAFISQLHVHPVSDGLVGLKLEAGSDHTVASNLYFGTNGGRARDQAAIVGRVQVEAEVIRDLGDADVERVFP